jgi:hypothetical protein
MGQLGSALTIFIKPAQAQTKRLIKGFKIWYVTLECHTKKLIKLWEFENRQFSLYDSNDDCVYHMKPGYRKIQ